MGRLFGIFLVALSLSCQATMQSASQAEAVVEVKECYCEMVMNEKSYGCLSPEECVRVLPWLNAAVEKLEWLEQNNCSL